MFNKFLLAATLITVASSQSASAGTLRFSGTTGGSNVTFGGKAWSFAVTYTPGAGATATITAATLLIGTESFY
jgi:hypothetical protein